MDSDVLTETRNDDIKHLPLELAEDILCQLTVKDLLRFRSVCRLWKTCIDSYRFKTKHFEAAKKSPPTLVIFRYLHHIQESHSLHFVFPHDPFTLSLPNPLNLGLFLDSLPLAQNTHLFEFKFSVVNGLVCMVYEPFLVIWNPSTKHFRKIDYLAPNLHESIGKTLTVLSGFGFDPITQDYKFVTIKFSESSKAILEIYSMRHNSWKYATIDFPVVLPRAHTGDSYLDGKFYWFVKCVYKGVVSQGYAIMQFDFTNEDLELIPWSYGNLFGLKHSVIVTTRGRLELIATFETSDTPRRCEVWMVRDEGAWSRRLNFGLSDEALIPRGIWKNDHILFLSKGTGWNRTVLLVDSTTGLCTNLEHDSTQIWSFTFVESLFSVHQEGVVRSN